MPCADGDDRNGEPTVVSQQLVAQHALVLLDLELRGEDGLTAAHELRRHSDVSLIMMMSGLGEEADRVLGLETAADDFVTKPFSGRALIARVRAQLRRPGHTASIFADAPEWDHAITTPERFVTVHPGAAPHARVSFRALFLCHLRFRAYRPHPLWSSSCATTSLEAP